MSAFIACLGCSRSHIVGLPCATCQAIADEIAERSHWPLEASLTPRVLAQVEQAIRHHIVDTGDNTELYNLANTIRAHLQHVVANARRAKHPTDEDLLA